MPCVRESGEVGMTNREYAYIVSRTLENKIAFAEENNQNTLLVTLNVLKDILALLKEQEERIKKFELERSWDEHPDTMGKW